MQQQQQPEPLHVLATTHLTINCRCKEKKQCQQTHFMGINGKFVCRSDAKF